MEALLKKCENKKLTYPVGKVNGARYVEMKDEDSDMDSDGEGVVPETEYEQAFVRKELQSYCTDNFSQEVKLEENMSDISSVMTEDQPDFSQIYSKHNFNMRTDVRAELPIDSYKEKILTRIELNQVIIIEGPTGCGKTTQVPQMILDCLRERNQYCNIAVTQPRKIATINVAKRVCQERGWVLGSVCGYKVGLEQQASQDALITYMTTGVLLQTLIQAKCLRRYTHIIIDEIHERNQDLDFLLMLVRKFMYTNSPHTKVILMSATIEAGQFAEYFCRKTAGLMIAAPIIKVEKRSRFEKNIFYLDHTNQIDNSMPLLNISEPQISDTAWRVFIFLINIFDKLDGNLEEEERNQVGSVLVFLPGLNAIEEAHEMLLKEAAKRHNQNDNTPAKSKWDIIPLHSSLPNDEQAKVFCSARPGHRKIILSTNIAESSITVQDSSYVIDFCLTKVMTIDPDTKYMSLKLEWATHTNCEQRAGRVGRTSNGRVYRLVPMQFYNDEMTKDTIPEMLRAPLDKVVLQSKMLELNETPAQILALCMNPPNLRHIETTIWHLKGIGGLLKTCRGVISYSDGDITFLGKVMASLPIDAHLAKMIVLGQLFSCLEETIIIAAGCSIQNIFSVPFQRRFEAYKKILLWADGSCSDLIALLNLYTVWQELARRNDLSNRHQQFDWCRRNLVNLKGLKEWRLLINEIKGRLERFNITETVGPGKVNLSDTEKPTILKVVMAGAFYPNYFLKIPNATKESEKDTMRVVGGRSPFNTVYFMGFDNNQPGHIYVRQLKRMIQDRNERCADVQIGFDGSTRIYVEFKNTGNESVSASVDGFNRSSTMIGRIPKEVFELIRKRQLGFKFELKMLSQSKAWEFAKSHGTSGAAGMVITPFVESDSFTGSNYSPIPSVTTQHIELTIINCIDPGHFYAHLATNETNELLRKIEEVLNRQALQQLKEVPEIGKIYAARYREDNKFYRCRIITTAGRQCQIMFIDYGNIQEVSVYELYLLPQRPQCFIAPIAFECVMHGIRPAYNRNPLGHWDQAARDEFQRLTSNILLYGEVYSVVNDVVELDLFRSQQKKQSISQFLLKNRLADRCSPSFLSKQNHELRLSMRHCLQETQNTPTLGDIISYKDFPDPDTSNDCSIVSLKGPHSPLETKVYACSSGVAKLVTIEGNSVNAVLLDVEPECEHSRLLVAAHVSQAGSGNKLQLRYTSLLPNVPGLPMLMAAIFCPTMEPKVSHDNSLVAAILCGLGYNEKTNKPYYPPYDLIIKLDTEFKIEELEMINRLRYLMNNGVKLMEEMGQNRATQEELLAVQINLKDHLYQLITMERSPINREISPQSVEWGKNGGLGFLKPNLENDEHDIWSLLWFVKIVRMNNYQKEVTKNLQDIENMLFSTVPFENITCLLCQADFYAINDLRFHVISTSHKSELAHFQASLREDVDGVELMDDSEEDNDEEAAAYDCYDDVEEEL